MDRLRKPTPADIEPLAQIWHDGWHEAHAAHVPDALTRLRTYNDFRNRFALMLAETIVCGPMGSPTGFCTLSGDELMHLFVDHSVRGTGAAGALLVDAEWRLLGRGVATAWLAWVIGNARAARFYEKSGWQRQGVITYRAETIEGAFAIDEWKYEKRLEIP